MRTWIATALVIGLLGCGRYGPPERRPLQSPQPASAPAPSVSKVSEIGAAEECEDEETKAEATAEVPR